MATKLDLDIAVDGPHFLPDSGDFKEYGITKLRVIWEGPAGGNPNLLIEFQDASGAAHFLKKWYLKDSLKSAGFETIDEAVELHSSSAKL
jgi:hypothetical protein